MFTQTDVLHVIATIVLGSIVYYFVGISVRALMDVIEENIDEDSHLDKTSKLLIFVSIGLFIFIIVLGSI